MIINYSVVLIFYELKTVGTRNCEQRLGNFTKLWEGNVFTGVCLSTGGGGWGWGGWLCLYQVPSGVGGYVQGWLPPPRGPGRPHPLPRHLVADTTRTVGKRAVRILLSYWNAFLLYGIQSVNHRDHLYVCRRQLERQDTFF